MELFKITCVTCRARLSVRDAALIGQIIGCPRCGMMVQVAAPAGTTATTPNDSSASGTFVAAAMVVTPPQPSLANSTVETAPASPPTSEISDSFDDATPIFAANDLAAPTPPPPPAHGPAAAGWASYKFAALLVAGAIAGSAVVAGALSWFNNEEQVAVAAPTNPDSKVESAIVEQPEESPSSTPDPTSLESPAATTVSESQADAFLPVDDPETAKTAAALDSPLAPVNVDPEPATTPPDNVGDAENNDEAATDDAKTQTVDSPPAEADAAPRLRIDPLDVDPEGLNLSTLFSGPPKDPLAESQLPSEEAVAPSVPPADANPDGVAPVPVIAQPPVRRDDRAGGGAPTDAALLTARRLPAIKLEKMPLCRLLDLSAQVSGLPVSVSPQQLQMAAISAATPATVDAKDATIEQLLTAALNPLRLKPVLEGDQVVLKCEVDGKRRTVDYAVDDLANDPQKVEQLANWVRRFAAPESWQANGGDATLVIDGGKLHVEAPVAVQYDVLFLLERYRVSRGLPTRTKYPAALLASGAFHAAVAERLAAPAVFTFSQYTSLREIFRYWQEELDVAVLVDWPALAEARLWPNSRIACSAVDKPWAEAMDSVLAPLGLGWRAVGRNTIEITTLAKVDGEPLLEVYRMAPSASVDADQLVARVRSVAGDAKPQAAEAIAYDAESRVLLVRQPAVVHRKLIAEMRDMLAAPTTAAAP